MESAPKSNPAAQDDVDQMPSWREVFLYFVTLGFINIGGPAGARYDEKVRDSRFVQVFLAGASAAVVGLIIVVSLELLPAALLDIPTIVIALISFLIITVLKVDVAKVALGAITGGALYASANALWPSA